MFVHFPRCAGALGPCHPHHVPAGLLAHMAEGVEVLHLHQHRLLRSRCCGIDRVPVPCYYPEAV